MGFSLSEAEAAQAEQQTASRRDPHRRHWTFTVRTTTRTCLRQREARAEAALTNGNREYNQVQVPEANHFFDGQDDPLIETTVQWLGQTVPVN